MLEERKKVVGDQSDSGSPCYACCRLLPLAFMEEKAQTKWSVFFLVTSKTTKWYVYMVLAIGFKAHIQRSH